MTEKPLWINLGCADDFRDGFRNVDLQSDCLYEYDPATNTTRERMDLRDSWGWMDSVVDYILARDIIEHLPDKIHTMNEAWRVLKPGGIMDIEVPTTEGMGAFQDPTHVSYWNRHSFWYFEKGNPYRERFANSYGIIAAFNVMSERIEETLDGPKLKISLEAVK